MARPVAIQDTVILEAARAIFLRDGYGASTAAVARKAGISEGSIFKRFKTKDELFLAAMNVSGYEQEWQAHLMAAVGTGDIHRTLERAANELLAKLQVMLPRIMLVSASGVTFSRCLVDAQNRPPPVRLIAILARYLRAEARLGRLAVPAPLVSPHLFISALSHYVVCERLFGYRSAGPKTYVRTLVTTLLRAAVPAPARRRGPARPKGKHCL